MDFVAEEQTTRVEGQGTIEPVPPARSAMMARVRQKNTHPELVVRRALHRLGYRFRIHRKDLPGCPDIVLPRLKTVVFVHGCFWHRHPGCPRATMPKTRREFWEAKFHANQKRDRNAEEALRSRGWAVETVWECQTRKEAFLSPLRNALERRSREADDFKNV